MGPIDVSEETRSTLVSYASAEGDLVLEGRETGGDAEQRIANVLRLIVSSREFQLA